MTQSLSATALAEGASAADAPADADSEPADAAVLLERHVRGDREAFAMFVRAHSQSIYGYLARSGVRPSDRDDLFQEVFCKVHRRLARGVPDGPARPWLFAIAVN